MTGSSDDNPFVIAPRNPKPWTKLKFPHPFGRHSADPKPARRWLRAVTVLAVCVFGVFGLHELTQKWLIGRLADNLEAHPPHVQIERLGMLAEFGEPGLPKIVAALASPDDTVSSTAFRVLRDLQGRWQTSHSDDVVSCQETLLRSISKIADRCPPERRPRIAELVNQIVLDTVGADGTAEADIYRRACDLLATVTQSAPGDSDATMRLASRPTDSFPEAGPGEEDRSERPMRLTPLPTESSIRIVRGPTSLFPVGIESTVESGLDRSASRTDEPAEDSPPRQIDSNQMPRLAPLTRSSFIVTPVPPEATTLSDNPLAAYDTRSVIDFVGSVQPALHQAAEEELRKRNFSDDELELATRLTSPSAQVRLAMVEELPSRADVDPRRWLIWLANDPERDVRLQAISRLGTMDDPEVREALRKRLHEERDPTVATRLRRFLGLR